MKTTGIGTRFLSMFLALVMIFTMLPLNTLTAYAEDELTEEATVIPDEDGTESDFGEGNESFDEDFAGETDGEPAGEPVVESTEEEFVPEDISNMTEDELNEYLAGLSEEELAILEEKYASEDDEEEYEEDVDLPGPFTVTFVDYNGVPLGEPQTVEKGESATAPEEEPTREGSYVFVAWDTDFSKVTKDLTVKAIYADLEDAYLAFRTIKGEEFVEYKLDINEESGLSAAKQLPDETDGSLYAILPYEKNGIIVPVILSNCKIYATYTPEELEFAASDEGVVTVSDISDMFPGDAFYLGFTAEYKNKTVSKLDGTFGVVITEPEEKDVKYCEECGSELDENGKCTDPDCITNRSERKSKLSSAKPQNSLASAPTGYEPGLYIIKNGSAPQSCSTSGNVPEINYGDSIRFFISIQSMEF